MSALRTSDEELDSDSQPWVDLGVTRTAVRSSNSAGPTWTYEFDPKKMPSFIPKESRGTLFEAGRSLRLLRDATDNGHPLCSGNWGLQSGWGWGEERKSR